ncbi:MAG: ribosome-binding factor A, partial [Campylobacterales bacterium]
MGKKREKSIRIQRKEAELKEVLGEAFGAMENPAINRLGVTDVVCSIDGSDAKVYLEKGGLTAEEQAESLKQVNNARRYIQYLCREITGWYRVPNLKFTFDDLLERENRL